jgi:hypothetical protein
MANPTVIVITNAHLLLGDTAADVVPGTGTGDAFECQVSSAAINANANLQTVPATFCAAESQAPAATGWELALTWLQDWTDPAGLSFFAFTNDTLSKYFSLTLDDSTTPVATGQVRIVAGAYGGDAATPLTATQTWPLVAKPDITPPALAAAAAVETPAESSAA